MAGVSFVSHFQKLLARRLEIYRILSVTARLYEQHPNSRPPEQALAKGQVDTILQPLALLGLHLFGLAFGERLAGNSLPGIVWLQKTAGRRRMCRASPFLNKCSQLVSKEATTY